MKSIVFFILLAITFTSTSQNIRVKRNQTVIWNDNNVPTALDTLILETNSTLILKTDVNLIVGRFIIGENVKILGIGEDGSLGTNYTGSQSRRKHGHGPGANGRSGENGSPGGRGYNFTLSTSVFEFGSVLFNTSGGNGGNGGNGEGGGKGSNGSCDGHSGGAGGNGGNGGNGGRGGNAGKVLISFNEIKRKDGAELGTDIKWIANGGQGGSRGLRGSGGQGGNSAKCGLTKQKGGNGGNAGNDGSNGADGSSYSLSQAEWLKYN
ncbi:hypothetical protein [Maribellus sediminis]|uniref:hypothetical protein n=1 Tax=Maribellus sediminis TaxID=2696285 RepID=UPI001430D084|nr:hypothetical protein [Maribellus sediminis]